MAHKIKILAYDGCFGSAALGPADLFGVANSLLQHQGRAAAFDTEIVSLSNSKRVQTASGQLLQCDGLLKDMKPARGTLLIPGMDIRSTHEVARQAELMTSTLQALHAWYEAGSTLAANCSATFLLAATGLLEGRRATTSWWLEDTFRDSFPAVTLEAESILVEDGRMTTAAAGTSHLDLALHLIGSLEGPGLASLCAHFMVIDGGRSSQRPYAVPWHYMSRDALIEKADAWIRKRLAQKVSIGEMARHLGMETRTMNRRFQKATGLTPQAYVKRVKMDRAKMHLETSGESIAEVAVSVGYEDENAFRRAFIASVGVTPAGYRRQFKQQA